MCVLCDVLITLYVVTLVNAFICIYIILSTHLACGCSKYFPGEVTRCRLNGSYDIKYEDGDVETGVKREFIRVLSSGVTSGDAKSSGSPKAAGGVASEPVKLSVGAKVECRQGGGR